jgi:hypothetical protein
LAAFRDVWRRLPLDGEGLVPAPDPELRRLRAWSSRRWWKGRPPWQRWLAPPAARLAWTALALRRAARFAKANRLTLAGAARLAADTVASGAQPAEAYIWRGVFGARHPLPARAAGLLLMNLGDAEAHALLADKQATAERLAAAGLAIPATRAILPAGRRVTLEGGLWSTPAALFLKPRRGAASRGALALDVLEDGAYRLAGVALDRGRLADRLAAFARADDLIVQDRLTSAAELADLATGGQAPVLRLTLARAPGGEALVDSGLLSIDTPGESPRNFIRGQLRAPVDLATGRLAVAIWFARPKERLDAAPWNGAAIAGRALPHFAGALDAARRAMALTPGLTLVNWDLILTDAGPVILEGNTAGDWILTTLAHRGEAASLTPILEEWAARAS